MSPAIVVLGRDRVSGNYVQLSGTATRARQLHRPGKSSGYFQTWKGRVSKSDDKINQNIKLIRSSNMLQDMLRVSVDFITMMESVLPVLYHPVYWHIYGHIASSYLSRETFTIVQSNMLFNCILYIADISCMLVGEMD